MTADRARGYVRRVDTATVERLKVLGEIEGLRSRLAALADWGEKAPGFKRPAQMKIADDLATADAKLGSVWLALGGTMKEPGYREPVAA